MHITPDVLEKMYFYDIMMLYHRYEDYINEENKSQELQQEEYEAKYAQMQSEMSSIKDSVPQNFSIPQMPSVPNYNFNGDMLDF